MFHSGGTTTPNTDSSPTHPTSLTGTSCLGPKHHHDISSPPPPPPPPSFVSGSYLSGYGSYYTHHHHAHSHHHSHGQDPHQSTTTTSSNSSSSTGGLGSLYSEANVHTPPPTPSSHHQLHPSQWYSSSHHFGNPFYPDWSTPHPSSFLSEASESQPYGIHHPSSSHGSPSYFKSSSPYAAFSTKGKGVEESILKSTEVEHEEDDDEKDESLLESHSLADVEESPLHHQTGEAPLTKGKGLGPFDWISNSSKRSLKSSSSMIGGDVGKEGSGRTRTKDKYRVVYSDHQRLELEKEFHYSRYITIRRKAELATGLGLTERQVKIWFQNRRAKERKQLKKRDEIVGGKETLGGNSRGSHSGSNNGAAPLSTHPVPSSHHIHPLESGLHHSMAFNPAAAAVMLSHRHHHPYPPSSGHHGTRDVLSSLATSPPTSS